VTTDGRVVMALEERPRTNKRMVKRKNLITGSEAMQ
jgi:hypothetical protein